MAIAMQFSELLPHHRAEKNAILTFEKLPEYPELLIFLHFSEIVALPAQAILHTEILICDGNTIIS